MSTISALYPMINLTASTQQLVTQYKVDPLLLTSMNAQLF